MIGRCRGITPPPVSRKGRTVVSSYAKAVTIGGAPVIVGERINPTGKARFKQALRENDMEYILREGIAQQESGAHVLDVNVGLPEIDETERMTGVVRALQGVTDLPLQIDTSDGRAMEAAMRLYNGKPLINSVNGKQESMDMVFPLVKKYGGVMVALTLDEGGIPETAEGRLRIAEKIVRRAEACGIDRRDILVDALTMTISTGAEAALVTLETVRRVKAELGVGTILGVSNISFGLPQRENINAAFYLMALQSGLDAAILNPNAEAMMKAYFSFRALSAQDEQCGAYIARYAGAAPAAAPTAMAAEMGLREAIVRGLKERAYQAAATQVKALAPLDIINDQLIPALDQVGQGFEKGTLFLPQLLMSAEAAQGGLRSSQGAYGRGGTAAGEEGQNHSGHRQGRHSRYWQEHCQGAAGKLRLRCHRPGQGRGSGVGSRDRPAGKGAAVRAERPDDHHGGGDGGNHPRPARRRARLPGDGGRRGG